MASPGSRWQLLLMADDGRIIPFRRIKGFLLVFLVLFMMLAVVCVGLGGWLVSEMVRHEQTQARLAVLESQVARCLEDRQSGDPAPAVSETRQKEAEGPENQASDPVLFPASEPMDSVQPAPGSMEADGENDEKPVALEKQLRSEGHAETPARSFSTETAKKPPSTDAPSSVSTPAATPVIALGDAFAMTHSKDSRVLKVRFRITNSGSRSSPVRGRCVVVLKPDGSEPDDWLVMPNAALVNGVPTGKRGNRFKISRYMDMTAKVAGVADPSRYSTATVYVFDSSGDKIVEKVYPLSEPVVPASNR